MCDGEEKKFDSGSEEERFLILFDDDIEDMLRGRSREASLLFFPLSWRWRRMVGVLAQPYSLTSLPLEF
jgi:hypothetical protein